MKLRPFTVTETNNYIKRLFEYEPILSNISVEGEISNMTQHQSGHVYFTLKDEFSRLSCVFFKHQMGNQPFTYKEGNQVKVNGKISVYERDGKYQLYVHAIERIGLGDLYVKFESLKEKLDKKGYFDKKHKKPIPYFNKKIAIITSPTGAVIQDIIHVTNRRSQLSDLVLLPVKVQGETAVEEMIRAIEYVNTKSLADVIILARGGGSMEDLWSFNDELLATAIFESNIPIISAIGHETDFTIADFVADLRAPTPSAAAEIATLSDEVLFKQLKESFYGITFKVKAKVKQQQNELDYLSPKRFINRLMTEILHQEDQVDRDFKRIQSEMAHRIDKITTECQTLMAKIEILNPRHVLEKGFSIVYDENGFVISSGETLVNNNKIMIEFKDSKINATVNK